MSLIKTLISLSLLFFSFSAIFAADVVDLSKQKSLFLRSFLPKPSLGPGKTANNLQEINQSTDFNNTLHVRVQQKYLGYPIWGADAIIHVPKAQNARKKLSSILALASQSNQTTMNGVFYQNIQKDLGKTPAYIFSAAQAEKALNQGLKKFGITSKNELIKHKQSDLVVYIDKNNMAHWAYHVNFYLKGKGRPSHPAYLLDAENFKIYKSWNNVKNLRHLDKVKGGGFGGNSKIGKLTYDGLTGNLPSLDILRDRKNKICYLANDDVIVKNFWTERLVEFSCHSPHHLHNNVYWDGEKDLINEAYSPSNDALYAGKLIKEMYQNWYGVSVLVEDNKPMVLEMITHSPNFDLFGFPDPDNALWDTFEQKMYFGDGLRKFYPLTSSIGVASHEISHGFTAQHSGLYPSDQSGGIDESFSDMAAQAIEYYAFNGKNSWKIGAEVWKNKDPETALRYMDDPTKDCKQIQIEHEEMKKKYEEIKKQYPSENDNEGNEEEGPAECSIDNVKNYIEDMDTHHSSGIFNRAFYVLATTPDWNVKKAFDVMVKANQNYWLPHSTFDQAACGVIWATRDYGYDTNAVANAFNQVGIDTTVCWEMV